MVYSGRMTTNQNSTADQIVEAIRVAERPYTWVADKAGFSPATLRRKLHGGSDFTVSEVARIARALNVKPSSLLPEEFRDSAAA